MKRRILRNLGILITVAVAVLFANSAAASEIVTDSSENQEKVTTENSGSEEIKVDENLISLFDSVDEEEETVEENMDKETTDEENESDNEIETDAKEEASVDETQEEKSEEEEAKEHAWSYTSNEDGTHIKTCSDCDEKQEEDCSFEDGKCIYCGYEEVDELELEEQTITVSLGSHELKVNGKMPEGTELSVKKNDDYSEMTRRVKDTLGDDHGFMEEESYSLEFTYTVDDETKSFVPDDFEEEYTASVSELGDKQNAYAIDSDCQNASNTFKFSDKLSITFGTVYNYKTSIYGKSNENAGTKVSAIGKGVTYTTTVNDRGEYLFPEVDYSKAFFGCCFEIKVG